VRKVKELSKSLVRKSKLEFRHILCESLGHINWEVVTAFDNSQLCKDLENSRVSYNRHSVQEAAKRILENQERIFDKNFILLVRKLDRKYFLD